MLSALMHVSTLCCLSGSSPSASSKPNPSTRSSMAASTRIAVVGDVHDDWNLEEDTKALQFLQPDLVLFTGRAVSMLETSIRDPSICVTNSRLVHTFDQINFTRITNTECVQGMPSDFGNENVELVQSIASLEFAKAVILGNHDSWFTQQFSGKKKDRVQLQLECLGEEHVAYRRLDFPLIKLSVVGGRPFSCGGEKLFRKRLLSARYGVEDMDGSAKRIYKAAFGTPEGHLAIFLAHNGPTGLGSNLDDICGKDWVSGGGDHGDPDLAQAISLLKETGKVCIPIVVFGHMHKELAYRNGLRKMIVVGADNTIYLNGAIVPRVKRLIDEQDTSDRSFMNIETPLSAPPESSGTMRAFTTVEILDGRVDKIAETWVSVVGDKTALKEEHVLFKSGN